MGDSIARARGRARGRARVCTYQTDSLYAAKGSGRLPLWRTHVRGVPSEVVRCGRAHHRVARRVRSNRLGTCR